MVNNRKTWEDFIVKNGIIEKDNCPFCETNISEEEKKLIIKQTDFWEIRYNKYPYAGIKKHLLVFPKRHVELTKDLNDKELLDLKNVFKFISDFFENEKYFSFLRETYSGRSIAHLHYHYLPGNIHSDDFEIIFNKNN